MTIRDKATFFTDASLEVIQKFFKQAELNSNNTKKLVTAIQLFLRIKIS